MAGALGLAAVVVEDENDVSGCCGTHVCQHTMIQHRNHVGYLRAGKLLCQASETERLIPCCLEVDPDVPCQRVDDLAGHVHGPGCGHEQVPHGDHLDYLVGDRLHHVKRAASTCCERTCIADLTESDVVDHGRVNVVRHRRRRSAHSAEEVVTTKIFAAGICCPAEIGIIHGLLEQLPGVRAVDVAVVTKSVRVLHDAAATSPSTLLAALNSARLEASLGEKPPPTGRKRLLPPWPLLVSTVLLAVSLLSYVQTYPLEYLKYVALGALLLACPPVVLKAWAALRCRTLDINVLMVIAAIGAVGLGDYVEAATIVVIFGFAEWLESRCLAQASGAVSSLMALQPEVAVAAGTGACVAVADICVGDELLVRPGERVPVDGTVVAGASALDESMLTGESRPVPKAAGDTLMSGTLNSGGGALRMVATAAADNSTAGRLAAVIEHALAGKSRRDRAIETVAKYYTPLVVAAAFILALVPSLLQPGQWRTWVYMALEVLVTACPCALVLSTPVAGVCALTRAARSGVLVKGSRSLEALAALRCITFDKTGTLTEGHFTVKELMRFDESVSEAQLLFYAAALEQHSQHPLAAAIIGHAAARGITARMDAAADVTQQPGLGVLGLVGGAHVRLCSTRAAASEPALDQVALAVAASAAAVHVASAVCVLVDGRLAGCLLLCDRVRADAAVTIKALRVDGIDCKVLSGDDPAVVEAVCAQLGLLEASARGGLSPEGKLEAVRDMRAALGTPPRRARTCGNTRGVLAHVGDGMNDAPALAAADVGVAMGVGGSALAVEAADVALFTNSLASLVLLARLSRRTWAIILSNIVFAIAVKVAMLVLIGFNLVSLWMAVLADVGSAVLVILNSLTLLRFTAGGTAPLVRPTRAGCKYTGQRTHQRSCCGQRGSNACCGDMGGSKACGSGACGSSACDSKACSGACGSNACGSKACSGGTCSSSPSSACCHPSGGGAPPHRHGTDQSNRSATCSSLHRKNGCKSADSLCGSRQQALTGAAPEQQPACHSGGKHTPAGGCKDTHSSACKHAHGKRREAAQPCEHTHQQDAHKDMHACHSCGKHTHAHACQHAHVSSTKNLHKDTHKHTHTHVHTHTCKDATAQPQSHYHKRTDTVSHGDGKPCTRAASVSSGGGSACSCGIHCHASTHTHYCDTHTHATQHKDLERAPAQPGCGGSGSSGVCARTPPHGQQTHAHAHSGSADRLHGCQPAHTHIGCGGGGSSEQHAAGAQLHSCCGNGNNTGEGAPAAAGDAHKPCCGNSSQGRQQAATAGTSQLGLRDTGAAGLAWAASTPVHHDLAVEVQMAHAGDACGQLTEARACERGSCCGSAGGSSGRVHT